MENTPKIQLVAGIKDYTTVYFRYIFSTKSSIDCPKYKLMVSD